MSLTQPQLHWLIAKYFNNGELQTLCDIQLDIEYENLTAVSRDGKVRELLLYCERHDLFEQLIAVLKVERPNVNWETWDEPATDASTISSSPQTDAFKFGNGLLVLAQLMRSKPQVRDVVVGLRKDFETARNSIESVSHYKQLHDLFQEMEASYNVTKHNVRQEGNSDNILWEEIETNNILLQGDVSKLLSTAEQEPYKAQAGFWLQLLRQGQTEMRSALLHKNPADLNKAFRFFARALERGLPRVNFRLVDMASGLPFKDLVEAMRIVQSRLDDQESSEVAVGQRLAEDISALEQLSAELEALINLHNRWQWMDDELRRIEALLGDDVEELKLVWPDLQEVSQGLYMDQNDDILVASRRLEEALVTGKPAAIVIRIFQTYRSLSSRRFRQVDDQLLALCQNLQHIHSRLEYLLGSI